MPTQTEGLVQAGWIPYWRGVEWRWPWRYPTGNRHFLAVTRIDDDAVIWVGTDDGGRCPMLKLPWAEAITYAQAIVEVIEPVAKQE